jgi:hypothetical protein
MSFIGVLDAVGKGFAKGLKWAVGYAVPVERLIGLVLLVEQKYAASGAQSGTGAQKLAEVVLLTEKAVTSLLEKAGVTANSSYLQNLVTAVVAILNVQQMPANASPAAS